MPVSITIRYVPNAVRDELAERAVNSGRSLQEYLRGALIELARRPTAEVVVARMRGRKELTNTHLPTDEILRHRDEERH